MTKGVLVAISGGVDSAVAVMKAVEAGYHTEAFHLRLSKHDVGLSAAAAIAEGFGIRLHIVDCLNEFEQEVIDYFKTSYLIGETPNPCVVCNPRIKIRYGLKLMDRLGLDVLVTGHYARVVGRNDIGTVLLKGVDAAKDQSYFLHQIQRTAFDRLWFPNGLFTKEEIKALAGKAGFLDIVHKESQEACFLKGDYRDFLGVDADGEGGEVVTRDGCILGRHKGLWAYTVGQRKGLSGLPGGSPWYVLALDHENNRLIVGRSDELLSTGCLVNGINWLVDDPAMVFDCRPQVKIRYRHQGVRAIVEPAEDGMVRVIFDMPQRAVTPGQFAVFYNDEQVLGGGKICG
ncbi:MAG: tRNA 2-thiouridine(34) synthase MnmA [Dissulfurimicrobium sp.]|uniref:tRNA 2-thiouridine(34) synthase MnmA n=1 Tax=Dissulfurimicrobium TaxID=1769732 RepID=UPI001ED9EB5E|nr:tRNA 2-thiouridine(34) synthase MnmA [Dissulfurimicrobium hydrothermale]UKL12978.1 tRNA 2-thiouridine(34) synthase MnmA [Dissulfurimicrobium hydrothermale]